MLFTLPFSLIMLALVSLLTCCLIMAEAWFWAKRIKNAGVADIFWYFNFSIIAFIILWLARGWYPRKFLVCGMVIIAGTRLGLRLLIRITRRLQEEDPQYKQLRKEWAPRPDRRFFWFFQARALSNILLCIPFFIITANGSDHFSAWEYTGAAIWLIALIGEATAGRQFPRLNYFSPRPDYFFEWLMWMSYFVFALGSPNGVLAIISPALILYLRAYRKNSSVFIPWFRSK